MTYLGDLVRQQENKVKQMEAERKMKEVEAKKNENKLLSSSDLEAQLEQVNDAIVEWNVTRDANGQIVEETIDPNDPKVRDVIMKNQSPQLQSSVLSDDLPAQEKILIMLKLLRERVKAEAAFFKGTNVEDNERGMNLRLLAYCIHAKSDMERQQVISEEIRSSLDKLDNFLELVKSSISYAESTTSELAPGKKPMELNLTILKKIEDLVEDMKEMQAFQAAGGSSLPGYSGGDPSAWQ